MSIRRLGRTFVMGRVPSLDRRNHLYLMPLLASARTSRFWGTGGMTAARKFDQGQTPQCVSYGTNRYLVASPIVNQMPESFEAFYKECQKNDGIWAPHDGSTVHAAFKVLRGKGLVSGYQWAYDVQRIIGQVLEAGPVVVGTDWTNSMFTPDPKTGFIGLGAYDVAGGHCYLISGASRNGKCPDGSKGYFEITNSWGAGWGKAGKAKISFADFSVLLNHQGEAAIATEVKK